MDLEAVKILAPVVGSVLVAWLTARAAGKSAGAKEGADLAVRVKTLEDNEPVDLRRDVDQALALARAAGADATNAKTDLARHVEEEAQRRTESREAAKEHSRNVAAVVDRLTEKVIEGTTAVKVLEARFNSAQDAGGVSRRGGR